MPRKVDEESYRIVIGSDAANKPNSINVEYRVVNDDLKEEPQRLKVKSPDFSVAINDLWAAASSATLSDAGL